MNHADEEILIRNVGSMEQSKDGSLEQSKIGNGGVLIRLKHICIFFYFLLCLYYFGIVMCIILHQPINSVPSVYTVFYMFLDFHENQFYGAPKSRKSSRKCFESGSSPALATIECTVYGDDGIVGGDFDIVEVVKIAMKKAAIAHPNHPSLLFEIC